MSPRVSIVIPSYNHEAFVGEAIRSVLDQSFEDFEVVITDDASTDGTLEVIRQFNDPRISFEVSERNRGGVVALNSAIRRSQGEFICYLASDDFFLPGKLARQVEFLSQHPNVCAVFGLPRKVDEQGRPLPADRLFAHPFKEPHPARQQWLRHFFFNSNSLCHPTAMIRRTAFEAVGLFDPRLWGLPDFDMWVRLCMRYDIHLLGEELSCFRVLDGARNISAPRRDSMLRDMFEFYQVLNHYRTIGSDLAREVFRTDLEQGNISTDAPYLVWLGEVALLGKRGAHKLFGLQAMYDGLAGTEGSHRLVKLVGSLDVLRIFSEQDFVAKVRQHELAKTQIAGLEGRAKSAATTPVPAALERSSRIAMEGLPEQRTLLLSRGRTRPGWADDVCPNAFADGRDRHLLG